ncbi:conserved hypothetical protein [Gammaproteobacteria bacterium]
MLRLKSGGPRVKNAQKTVEGGHTFDSKMEAARYLELQQLARAGRVSVIELQPVFELQGAYRKCPKCGRVDKRKNPEDPLEIKCPYRVGGGETCGEKRPFGYPITYRADFRVTYADGHQEIEDVKGMETEIFKLKKKLFDYKYPDLTLKIVKGRGKK